MEGKLIAPHHPYTSVRKISPFRLESESVMKFAFKVLPSTFLRALCGMQRIISAAVEVVVFLCATECRPSMCVRVCVFFFCTSNKILDRGINVANNKSCLIGWPITVIGLRPPKKLRSIKPFPCRFSVVFCREWAHKHRTMCTHTDSFGSILLHAPR